MADKKNTGVPLYFARNSRTDIQRAAVKLRKDIQFGKDINWKVLFDVYRNLKFNEETLPYCIKFLIEILNLLDRYSCRERYIIEEILEILFYSTQCAFSFSHVRRFIYRMKIIPCDHKVLRKMARRELFDDLFGMNSNLSEDMIWITAEAGNHGLLSLMLKYGQEVKASNRRGKIREEFFVLQKRLRKLQPMWNNIRFISFENINHFISTRLSVSKHRLCLWIRTFDLITRMSMSQTCAENYVHCYTLLLDSIKDTHVSVKEVRYFLKRLLPNATEDSIHGFVQSYKTLFPEAPETPEPRILQHLCRIQIRDSLRQTYNLPLGVSSLKLPKILKKYVLLNDEGDYSIMTKNLEGLCPVLQTSSSAIVIPSSEDTALKYVKRL